MNNGEKPFQCIQCDMYFKQNSHLKVHMTIHAGEKPYKCKQCNKSFRLNSNRKVHMRWHTGEKPYQCNQCDKSFTHKSKLKNHIICHTGDKPYKSEQCDQFFTKDSTPKVYTGEKPYKCKHCYRFFKGDGNLKVHMRKHTEEKPCIDNVKSMFSACIICYQLFDNLNTCKQHMKTHMKCVIQVKDSDLNQKSKDYRKYKDTHSLNTVINVSGKDIQNTKIMDTKEKVSIKVEQDLVKDVLEQEELHLAEVKVEEHEILDVLSLMKQEILDNDVNK